MNLPTASKQLALDLFEANRAEFLEECRRVAKQLASESINGEVTIDDVREIVTLPEGIDGRVFGAVFNKEWVRVGYTQTKRASSHRRPIAVFKLKKPETANTKPLNYQEISWRNY